MKNKRHTRSIKRLALICTLCTVILVVSTYAWFVGMKTVNVSSFDVEIAATDGLSLSLNGKDWAETITINKANHSVAQTDNDAASKVYVGNTNTWGGNGLVPISTVGQIDATASRLIMFEKGSLTTTPGGYRLMASRVDNHTKLTESEGNGFVAFDLFVRNLSGSAYYADYNQLNEEAIYLTQNSAVTVDTTGGADQSKTGIENSVRVAFAQIGRVQAVKDNSITDTTLVEKIQKISCASGSGVTGICDRYAQIWEPNDKKHVANAINWYNAACLARTNEDLTKTASYSGSCNGITETSYVQTYAVGSVIDFTNKIDVYDGKDLNKYEASTSTTKVNGQTTIKVEDDATANDILAKSEGKLYEYDYFTDTEKMQTGMDRPTFITLAPNSITKIRVYVYLEGQDVDNYDFASLGKQIKVNFGFTKERFYQGDINYDGPTEDEDRNLVVPSTPEAAA